MKKTLERRLRLLESKYRPGEPKIGFYLYELGFIVYFEKRWPDEGTAPKFLLAEYNRIARRGENQPSRKLPEETARRTGASTESTND